MPWVKTAADRAKDAATYGSPEYRRNRAAVRRRSGGRCEWPIGRRLCGSRDRVQCDHKTPVSQGGTHDLANLWDICKPHHDHKTAREGAAASHSTARRDPPAQPRTRW